MFTAACLAVASAPAGLHNSATNSFFEFDEAHFSPNFFNVQDETKWIKVTDLGACSNSPVKACRIEVSSAYVRGNYLLPTTTIIAQESSPGIAYVVGGNTVNIRNKK